MEEQPTQGLVLVEHESYAQAVLAAAEEASATMASTGPALTYKQGNRHFVVTSFPLTYVAERIRIDNLRRGQDPSAHLNRPLVAEHHRAITNYLVRQSEDAYILPPLSLATPESLRCHVPKSVSPVRLGVLILPTSLQFEISDGQHRVVGIANALKQAATLGQDAIAATIACGSDVATMHVDFFDCSQTLALPPSLLTMFDLRDPLAKLTREVADEVPVLRGRVEKTSKTVGKSPVFVFTANQIRAFVGEFMTGNSARNARQLRADCAAVLKDEESFAVHKKAVMEFLSQFTGSNKDWLAIASSGDPAVSSIDVHALRQESVSLTATGLIIVGRVGYALRALPDAEKARLVGSLGRDIDWSRSGELWQGTVVTPDGRILTQLGPVEAAVIKVKQKLGLPLTKSEVTRLQRLEAVAA